MVRSRALVGSSIIISRSVIKQFIASGQTRILLTDSRAIEVANCRELKTGIMSQPKRTTDWKLEEALGEEMRLDPKLSQNLVHLIETEQCTLPFIARYRKHATKDLSVEKLREVFETLQQLKSVKVKIEASIKKIEGSNDSDFETIRALQASRTNEEVDFIMAPLKASGGSRTLAGKAMELGLDSYAEKILAGCHVVLPNEVTDAKSNKVLDKTEVQKGIEHILADIMSKDADIRKAVTDKFYTSDVRLVTTKKADKSTKSKGDDKPKKNNINDKTNNKSIGDKYDLYADKTFPVRNIQPHQVLAINRAESLKVISVKVTASDHVERLFDSMCKKRWPLVHSSHQALFSSAVADSYKRLVFPMLSRLCRAQLKKDAEWSSIDVFGNNLRALLLQPPCRKLILGIDPGFTNGCKIAVISATGSVLDTTVAYLHVKHHRQKQELQKIISLVKKHRCSTIALGNGTACRETEAMLSDAIAAGDFRPVDIKYCIVNEDGSSVYSVSKLAEEELPTLEPNLRSAVSIARRLQDPLIELVKIEPHHIGVGMYQHDIPEAKLKVRLGSVLTESVSFVGVDINTATEQTLSHVSGLTATKARAILAERARIGGSFVCREQLLAVKGMGAKCYEQCAGFVLIRNVDGSKDSVVSSPSTKGARSSKRAKLNYTVNPLDQTVIHPNSYHIAHKVLDLIGIDISQLGLPNTVTLVRNWATGKDMTELTLTLDTDMDTLAVILEALMQPLCHDIRDNMTQPLFRSGKTSADSLVVGEVLTGAVRNVTAFGAFVDIGVKNNGLIHKSKLCGKTVNAGVQVKVKVLDVDLVRERIGLELVEII